ncbi:MAG: DEAD/DEAH box helicase [Nocardioides sp.]
MPVPDRSVAATVRGLTRGPGRVDRLVHLEVLPARTPAHRDWPSWVATDVRAAFEARGITRLWSHQRQVADTAYDGHHVIVATGTASGKSLGYLLPTMSRIRQTRGTRGERGTSVLYLAPTKALAHDQLGRIRELDLDVRASTHDGDSNRDERAWSRQFTEYLLTNPDMLHSSLLPTHQRWADFLSTLKYVVVDECHHYRGIFGAHVAHVLRRLRRVARVYGADPTFMLASATIADPELTAGRLIGAPAKAVTDDGSPRGELAVALWEPPLIAGGGENGAPTRRSATSEATELLADLVAMGVATLAFVRSRRGVEYVAARAAELLAEVDPALPTRVASYRGGYLPEERRAIETDLRAGRITGLASTSALELGIDVAGLDAVLIAGFPGTRAALWQQLGRAGRAGADALGVVIARPDPMDTYLIHHPDSLLGAPIEASVFDHENPRVLGPQLCAAAAEVPLREADLALFADSAAEVVQELCADGLLRRRARGRSTSWFWTHDERACDLADIRSAGGPAVQLIERETGRVIGTVDGARAHSVAHAGAVYLHRGETWLVEALDAEAGVATMTTMVPSYSTAAREVTSIAIHEERLGRSWPGVTAGFGTVGVTHQVVSYLKRREPGGEVIGEVPLDLPPRSLVTSAVWWTVDDDLLGELGHDDLPGAAHAAEHCAIGLLPVFATCDRWDIGGVSTARHPDTDALTVFVYDGYPGGAGFADRGYRLLPEWLSATRQVLVDCPCLDGCPSCVQSPKCGNQNSPLDKAGARKLLEVVLRAAAAG